MACHHLGLAGGPATPAHSDGGKGGLRFRPYAASSRCKFKPNKIRREFMDVTIRRGGPRARIGELALPTQAPQARSGPPRTPRRMVTSTKSRRVLGLFVRFGFSSRWLAFWGLAELPKGVTFRVSTKSAERGLRFRPYAASSRCKFKPNKIRREFMDVTIRRGGPRARIGELALPTQAPQARSGPPRTPRRMVTSTKSRRVWGLFVRFGFSSRWRCRPRTAGLFFCDPPPPRP